MPQLRLAIVFFGAVLAAACASPGADRSPPEAAEARASQTSREPVNDGDRVVCKEIRKTGTRFGTRQCLTVAQWEAIRAGAEESVSEVQRRASHQQDMPGQGN